MVRTIGHRKMMEGNEVDPQKVFEPYSELKNSPLGPQKVKNDPKIKSNSKVRIFFF